ncbi:PucR family transcriptional regulator [Nocardioides limicola]|uniref:PucR family transcriptional regulator n=1 Tax=Nocardioides limicola TaxID=2803368 RepID=UPI00193B8764|nr:PucR family transcriptional regulator [Nocardioides sp. DJM-14]
MALTLRDLLASDPVRRGRPLVMTGGDHLDRPIRWVHVSEVAEVPGLLSGGELILTVGHPLTGSGAQVRRYVDGLVEAGVCGLVVELGAALPAIPAAVLDRAEAHGLPVVALRDQVRFVEITELAHRAIVAEQFAFVDFARSTHEAFTRLSLAEAGVQEIVDTAAELCDSSVVLEDLSRTVLAYRARGRPAAGLLADWEQRSRRTPYLTEVGLVGDEGWMAASVGIGPHAWGRLVVPDPRAAQDRLAMVLERAAQALELHRMAERDRYGLELQAQAGLLVELLTRAVPTEADASARASALGLPVAARYLPVVVQRRDSDGVDPRSLPERVAAAARGLASRSLVGQLRAGQVGVLVAVPAATVRPSGRDSGRAGGRAGGRDVEDRLLQSLADALPEDHLLGVGTPAPTLLAAGAGLAAAQHVAEVAVAMPGPERVRRVTDVRLHGLIALLHDDPRVQAFTEAELAPLLEHEGTHGDGLIDLLRDYLAVGGNKSRLAQRAHRSRSAVYARLDRLERLLGVSLDDPASVLSLGVAMLAHDHSNRVRRTAR